jgi:NTE family protein
VLDLDPRDFEANSGTDLTGSEFRDEVYLTDGGVYDNLGLETAWKKYRTILVSDGGGRIKAEVDPKRDWPRHAYRVLNLIDSQVRSLRKRQVIGSFRDKLREGAYWGIWANITDDGLADPLDCPVEQTTRLAETATRLKRLEPVLQERLINWGYAICDCALRTFHDRKLPKGRFPYQSAGVG